MVAKETFTRITKLCDLTHAKEEKNVAEEQNETFRVSKFRVSKKMDLYSSSFFHLTLNLLPLPRFQSFDLIRKSKERGFRENREQ